MRELVLGDEQRGQWGGRDKRKQEQGYGSMRTRKNKDTAGAGIRYHEDTAGAWIR